MMSKKATRYRLYKIERMMNMAKKPFAWDTEELIKVHTETEKKEHEIRLCTLKEKEYVSVTERQLTNEGWKIKKNRTMPLEVFNAVQDALKDVGR